jgi:hypothetical protein
MTDLSDKEQEEMKTLQEERKTGHMSDSNRTRLSELLKKEDEGKPEEKGTAKAAPSSSAAPAGKK